MAEPDNPQQATVITVESVLEKIIWGVVKGLGAEPEEKMDEDKIKYAESVLGIDKSSISLDKLEEARTQYADWYKTQHADEKIIPENCDWYADFLYLTAYHYPGLETNEKFELLKLHKKIESYYSAEWLEDAANDFEGLTGNQRYELINSIKGGRAYDDLLYHAAVNVPDLTGVQRAELIDRIEDGNLFMKAVEEVPDLSQEQRTQLLDSLDKD